MPVPTQGAAVPDTAADTDADKLALQDLEAEGFPAPHFEYAPAPVGAAGMEPNGLPGNYLVPPGPGPATRIREAAYQEQRRKRFNIIGVIWAVTALVLVVAFVLAVLNRQTLAERAPGTATLFAALGLEAVPGGVVLEGLDAAYDESDALAVSLEVRNVSRDPRTAEMRLSLLDAQGAELAARPLALEVPPEGGRSGTALFAEVPEGAVRARLSGAE